MFLLYVDTWMCLLVSRNQTGLSAGALSVAEVSPEAKDGGHLSPIPSVAEFIAGDHLRTGPLLRVFCLLPCREQTVENDAMRDGVSALDSVCR
jgi:hypothetical protein